jgi:hypothetical protein
MHVFSSSVWIPLISYEPWQTYHNDPVSARDNISAVLISWGKNMQIQLLGWSWSILWWEGIPVILLCINLSSTLRHTYAVHPDCGDLWKAYPHCSSLLRSLPTNKEDVIKLRIHIFANGDRHSFHLSLPPLAARNALFSIFFVSQVWPMALVTAYGNFDVTLNDLCS